MQKLEEPFLFALKITLDEGYTESVDEIYRTLIKLVLSTMAMECQRNEPSEQIAGNVTDTKTEQNATAQNELEQAQ